MINKKVLKDICTKNIQSFAIYGNNVKYTSDGILISSIKAENKILGIAHLDYVADNSAFKVEECLNDTIIFNGSLDDRLGAYALLYELPRMGLSFDVLLTEGEERGRSTAQYFESEKQYNWMFSFDRAGDDFVMYQYENNESIELLNKYGFNAGVGSMSDISFLDHLNCVGFNFGVGYYLEHSKNHYASINTFKNQLKKFTNFFNENKNNIMPYDHTSEKFIYNQYNKYESLELYYCEICGMDFAQFHITPKSHINDIDFYTCYHCFESLLETHEQESYSEAGYYHDS